MYEETTAASAERAGRREWIGLAVLTLPTLLLSVDLSVLFLALPRLTVDLHASSTQQLWIMDIYGFMLAGFLVTMGTLGDRIGRRKLLLIGASAFGLASVVAAYSVNAEMLIATRALMGIAGATQMPSTLALISNMFKNAKQRGLAIAAWMSCFVGGTAIGPVVGGTMLQHFWWGSVFLLGVPVMVLLLAAAPVLLPEFRDPNAGRLDLASVALSLGTILPVIYGLKETAKSGLAARPVLAIAVGLIAGIVFVRRQRTLTHPLFDLRLFRNRSFTAALTVFMIGGAIMGGIYLFVTLYLQMVEGFSPLRAGLWLVPSALAMITSSMLTPVIARRLRPGTVIAGGMALSAIGFLVLSQVDSTTGPVPLVIGFVIIGFGSGPYALCTDLVVGSAPPEKAGAAASVSETSAELGIALGLALLGSVGTAIYRGHVTVPSGIPADASAAAREGLAGAVSVAGHLPAAVGGELLDSARAAFTSGLNAAAVLGAVLFVGLTVLAATALRHVRPSVEPEIVEPKTIEREAIPAQA
ncbi:MAG TPA: MFS transporter [Streptosporangiaceae bacterium]|jgi:DHA2 family multidrug resistance protein-like MFS transporter